MYFIHFNFIQINSEINKMRGKKAYLLALEVIMSYYQKIYIYIYFFIQCPAGFRIVSMK